ncbi:MAG: hypothetical protein ACFE9S_12470 [Candidatus Hermodarchaeota archaeon]
MIEMNFSIFNLILLIIFFLAIIIILVFLLLPWLFRLFVSPKFNASYVFNSKDFKEKEKLIIPKIEQEQFHINFNNNLGTYSILFGKDIEFLNGIVEIRNNSRNYSNYRVKKRNSKILELISSKEVESSDKLGVFKSIMVRFRLEDEERYINIVIKHYTNQNFIIFELSIPEGLENTSSGKSSQVITSFPSFINKNFNNNKVFTYRNKIFCPPSRKIGATSAPVLLYDNNLNCFVLSPLDGFLHTIISEDKNNRINCGIQREIKALPKGFSQSYILLFNKGINQSLKRLGDILLKYHDSKRKSLYANIVTSYLGYWTDNGAYYYYKKENGMNYEDTMISLKEYFEKNRIPIKYYNFDSWWYLKHTNKIFTTLFRPIVRLMGGGLYGNTLCWEVDPKNFTTDLKTFHREKFKKPITAHSRRWDARSPYVENYDFKTYKNHAVPLNKEFWQFLMKHAKESGIQVYEQDWMKNQIASMPLLMQNYDAQEDWLNSMATAAKENSVDIFYCMQTPGILLYSIKHSNANISRCSGDYNHRWPLSYRFIHSTQTNILFNAIGINSHPDVFRSRSMENVKIRPFSESYPEFNCLYQILNAGVVAPGDRKEYVNWPLLQKTCRDDGLLLKPDKSLTANDLMFKKHKKYYICDTFTNLNDLCWRYILVSNIWPRRAKETFFTLEDLGFEGNEYVLYDYYSGKLNRIKTNDLIEVGRIKRNDYKYYIICPITSNGMALLGCPDKFITCSSKLIVEIKSNENSMVFSVENLKDADIRLLIYSEHRPGSIQVDNKLVDSWDYINDINLIELRIVFDKSGRKEVIIHNNKK